MARFALSMLLVFATTGCGADALTTAPVVFPNGRPGFKIDCPANPAQCDQEARRICSCVYRPELARWACSGNGTYDLVATSPSEHSIEVACRAPATPPVAPVASRGVPAALSTEEIAQRALQSTVLVRTPVALGSGFIVAGGLVATNLHVVEGQESIVVVLPSGAEVAVRDVRGIDRLNDLVLLDLKLDLSPLPAAAQAEQHAGSSVVVVGNPRGLTGTVSSGILSGTRKTPLGQDLLQLDAPISPGSSGGPVLDRQGQVIGVVRMYVENGQNLNFAVPARYLSELLRSSQSALAMDMTMFAAMTAPAADPTPAPAPMQQPSVPVRAPFPDAVAGFVFGSSIDTAQGLCSGRLSGTPSSAICPFQPVELAFAQSPITLTFVAGELTEVWFKATSRRDALDALSGKYGDPDDVSSGPNGNWMRAADWPQAKEWGAGKWFLHGGSIGVVRNGPDFFVLYVSAHEDDLERQNY